MKSYKVLLLSAEIGMCLHNKKDNSVCIAIQLPIDADITDWEEITNEEAEILRKPVVD